MNLNLINLYNKKVFFIVSLLITSIQLSAQKVTIPIASENHMILLQTDHLNRLRTINFGKPLQNQSELEAVGTITNYDENNSGIYNSAYTPAGTWNLSEPAIQVKHADGNPSLELKYSSYKKEQIDVNTSLTSIVLKDPVYPFEVTLCYKVWSKENVIEQWTEIRHKEKKQSCCKSLLLPICTFQTKISI